MQQKIRKAGKMRERKFSTSLQLSESQFDSLEKIIDSRKDKASMAQILREAFDLYVQTKYPQFQK